MCVCEWGGERWGHGLVRYFTHEHPPNTESKIDRRSLFQYTFSPRVSPSLAAIHYSRAAAAMFILIPCFFQDARCRLSGKQFADSGTCPLRTYGQGLRLKACFVLSDHLAPTNTGARGSLKKQTTRQERLGEALESCTAAAGSDGKGGSVVPSQRKNGCFLRSKGVCVVYA